ncbi:hypothetical protein PCL_00393 [Purpureocillium lilacinum]|uniref:Uncharacterized protein n=1 Tax=Purpureocillium lilacinum TaxID=33203 RepID=A0A2U3E6Z7_PURLI|nr:hypothetical protein PCL_00393 [Purpureocillium lilacinum]
MSPSWRRRRKKQQQQQQQQQQLKRGHVAGCKLGSTTDDRLGAFRVSPRCPCVPSNNQTPDTLNANHQHDHRPTDRRTRHPSRSRRRQDALAAPSSSSRNAAAPLPSLLDPSKAQNLASTDSPRRPSTSTSTSHPRWLAGSTLRSALWRSAQPVVCRSGSKYFVALVGARRRRSGFFEASKSPGSSNFFRPATHSLTTALTDSRIPTRWRRLRLRPGWLAGRAPVFPPSIPLPPVNGPSVHFFFFGLVEAQPARPPENSSPSYISTAPPATSIHPSLIRHPPPPRTTLPSLSLSPSSLLNPFPYIPAFSLLSSQRSLLEHATSTTGSRPPPLLSRKRIPVGR